LAQRQLSQILIFIKAMSIASLQNKIYPPADRQQPLRVMQICLSKSWGGLEMYPAKLSRALMSRGCEIHGLVLANTKVAHSFEQAQIFTMAFKSGTSALLSVRQVLRYINDQKIDVLHAHKSGDMRLAALLVQFEPNLKLFFTDHIGVTKPKKGWYHRWAYSKVNRVFSISKATHAANLEAFALESDRITHLYNGIDLEVYGSTQDEATRLAVRDSLGVPRSGILIAMPGRLTPGKGQMLWLQALAELAQMPVAHPWHGVLIGEASDEDAAAGGYKAQLQKAVVDLRLSDRVTFAGFRDDMVRCLQASDITTIPSFREAFGLLIIEAMAAGCAIIGSNSGAIPELIVADTGLLATPRDAQDWAHCLAQLITEATLRTKLGRNARARALANFGMDTHADQLMSYYRQAKAIGL
jgi:glycosyltransferase involved in cell wall biosynthesis